MTSWGWAALLVGIAAVMGIAALAAPGLRGRRNMLLIGAGLLVVAAVVVGVVAVSGSDSDAADDEAQGAAPDASPTVTIDNRVTDGSAMREDPSPAHLSSLPENLCKSRGCAVPDTDMASGDTLTATCTTEGERTTNGDDSSAADDDNPDLHTSSLWYGAPTSDGQNGFISEVWLSADDRGGLGLPAC